MSMKPAINAGAGLAAGAGAAAAQGAQIILQADETRAKRLNSIFDGIYRYQDRRDANLKFQKEMAIKDKDLALKQGQLNIQTESLRQMKNQFDEIWGTKNANEKNQSLGVQETKAKIAGLRSGAFMNWGQGRNFSAEAALREEEGKKLLDIHNGVKSNEQ